MVQSSHYSRTLAVPKVPCRFCKTPTSYTGTKECNGCHEVAIRVRTISPAVLAKIICDEMPLQSRREVVTAICAMNAAERAREPG